MQLPLGCRAIERDVVGEGWRCTTLSTDDYETRDETQDKGRGAKKRVGVEIQPLRNLGWSAPSQRRVPHMWARDTFGTGVSRDAEGNTRPHTWARQGRPPGGRPQMVNGYGKVRER